MKNEQEIVRSVFDAYIRDIKAVNEKHEPTIDMLEEVKNRAIRALEQQPSEDCVSREKVLYIITGGKYPNEDYEQFIDRLVKELEALPPVTPTHCIAEVKFSKDDLREICNERIEIECTHGTCKDCIYHGINNEHTDIDGARYCSSFRTYTGYDFYCAEFEMRGNEE